MMKKKKDKDKQMKVWRRNFKSMSLAKDTKGLAKLYKNRF